MKILYVEDNPLDANLTQLALAKTMPDAVITNAATVAEAKIALENPAAFDIVLCDYRLPDGTGLDVLADIRQNQKPLPAVILTGLGDEETAVAALKAGADDYVIKRDGYLDDLPPVLENVLAQFHAEEASRTGGIRVLYVEHNTADADLTQRHMARHAAHITLEIVPTAADALAQLPRTPEEPCPWDVLLLDYRLPGLNALEALKIIRYERKLDVPVIMVTGKGNEELAAKALRLGATDYLVKREGYLMQLPHALENVFHLVQLKRERDALHRSESHYRQFFENDLTADFVADPDGNLLDCNPAYVRLFGFESREQALAADTSAFLPDPTTRATWLPKLVAGEKVEYQEVELRRVDGSPIFVIMNIIAITNDAGQTIELDGYMFDITERKHYQEQFYQAQKMEALGQLAGGVAHDFNNLLVPILGYAEMGMRKDSPGGQFYSDFEHIKAAAERAAQLTRQILAFSRRQVMEMVPIDLNSVVKDFHTMLNRLLKENISLAIKLAPKLPPIRADKSQIEQVLLNLVVNARDAMPDGGRLSITTEDIELDQTYSASRVDIPPGHYVLLTVSDTGCGMDSETQKRIFEPFFTTKDRGAGTGLGLSTVFGIVKQHSGNIFVYSEPGHGTIFKIYFPVTGGPTVDKKSTFGVPSQLSGIETILVVEDNDDVRELVTITVESFGYHVLEAESPLKAIEIAGEYTGRIDLLLTDLIMPDMNGQALYQRLVAFRPDLHVLFMSGYTEDILSPHEGVPKDFRFVQKPFDIETLLKQIRLALA